MKKRNRGYAALVVFILGIFLFGQSVSAEMVANVVVNTSGISFVPRINSPDYVLSIAAPDGSVTSESYGAGTVPGVRVSGAWPDGVYTYELKAVRSVTRKSRTADNIGGGDSDVIEPASQNGHFMVQGGRIIPPTGFEVSHVAAEQAAGQPDMDIVQADDLIVTGSQCIGFDCLTDGTENFGFDTLKLKENNLRLFFEDTSAGAFPSNDWRIIANDSASGGGNYFSIEDSTAVKVPFKIEAGAKTSALYISSAGRIGLGTATPVLNMHILHGDTPAVRFDQDTSSGWTAQVWDMAGNESNFFVRDVTGGSKLPFRIQPGAPTNTVTMKSDGSVGFGTWSPEASMELERTGSNAVFKLQRTDGSSGKISADAVIVSMGSTSDHPLQLLANNTWRLKLMTDNSLLMKNGASLTLGGVWTDASSRELKENIQGLSAEEARAALLSLAPVKYNYKADGTEKHVGFIAEDVPSLVASKDRKGLSPMDIVAVLTKTVQEQQKTIESLDQKIISLERALNRLAAMNVLSSAAGQ
jgi:hypothetical protein